MTDEEQKDNKDQVTNVERLELTDELTDQTPDKSARANPGNTGMVIAGVVSVACVSIIAIAAAFMLIFLNYSRTNLSTTTQPAHEPAGEIILPSSPDVRPMANFNTAGDPNAPVKIIEYSDFQCPYCGRFAKETEPKIMETYVTTSKVFFEFHSAGEFIGGPGGESIRAAEAAYCAGDQNRFWAMHDILFANQNGENGGAFSDTHLTAFAKEIGLDAATFNNCFTRNKYLARGRQDEKDAIKDIQSASNFDELVAAGMYSQEGIATPSFLINGRLLAGAQPFEVFQKEIEAALVAAGK